MTKMLKTCIGVAALLFAAFTASVQANQCCGPYGGCDIGCGKVSSLWEYGGHIEVGLYGNNHGQRNTYSGAKVNGWNPRSGNTEFLGPARMADFQMNQLYGYFGKELDTRCGWDIGGRVDFMYGTDAIYTSSKGLEYNDTRDPWGKGDYLASIPQIYGEIGYRNLSVKLGKFYSPLEHGQIMSPNRFFYSTSYVHHLLLPVTQTGALATWDVNSRLSVYGGWTCGEDGIAGNSTFANAKNNAALFGFDYKINRKINLGYGVLMGKDKESSYGDEHDDYFVHAFTVNIQPNRCWDYSFEWVLRNNNVDGESLFAGYGINQELIYKLNRCWAFGARGEWAYLGGPAGHDANFYQFTLGTNWTPNNWLVVRPEIRYDHCDEKVFKPDTKKDQFGFGVSTIVKF